MRNKINSRSQLPNHNHKLTKRRSLLLLYLNLEVVVRNHLQPKLSVNQLLRWQQDQLLKEELNEAKNTMAIGNKVNIYC